MAKLEPRPIRQLVGEARLALKMSQARFGSAVRASHRTAVRWDAGQSSPGDAHRREMIRLLVPTHRDLAAEIAATIHQTLESLGHQAPSAAPPARLEAADRVDLVVLAAVEQGGALPAVVRPMLRAAFERARELGLSTEAVAERLRPTAKAARR